MSLFKTSTRALALTTLTLFVLDASAATIRVQCEQRGDRARISVDGKNLVPGVYSSAVLSGGNMAASPAQRTVGDELQVDYDSNPADIRAGAVAISSTFISSTNPSVTGKIVDASGATVIADTVTCRVRSR